MEVTDDTSMSDRASRRHKSSLALPKKLFTRTADVLPPPLNCSHVKMKNNLKWMASRAEVWAKAGAFIGPPTEENRRCGVVCRAPGSRGHPANPNVHGLRRQSRMRERRRLHLEPWLSSHPKALSLPPARDSASALHVSNHCLCRYQAPSDRIKVKSMQKMPIFQVEPTETDRNYFHAMETKTTSPFTPTPTPCGLLLSNHKPAKNGRNQSRSGRGGVFEN